LFLYVLAFSDECRLDVNFVRKISELDVVLKFVIPVFDVLPFPLQPVNICCQLAN